MQRYAAQHVAQGVEFKTEIIENEIEEQEEVHYLYQLVNQQHTPPEPLTMFSGPGVINDKVNANLLTSYHLGDDGYDVSFSLDSPAGEFLGECGVGISEAIDSGPPKKVTALEIWVFDKNNTQTATKVIISPAAYADNESRKRLAEKGELVLAKPGRQIVLETNTMQVVARVIDLSFGNGGYPRESYFKNLTIEFQFRSK